MKLVYDMRILGEQMHGMARYALELLSALLAGERDLEVKVLVRRQEHAGPLPDDPRLETVACDLAPYGLKSQLALPGVLKKLNPDVYHCPFYAPPVRYGGAMVFTIHDLIHLRFPRDHGLKHRLFYRLVVGPAARKAHAVFTVSEHSRQDIVGLLGVKPERVKLTPNGVGAGFRPLDQAKKTLARKTLSMPEGFILGVGNKKPHKNLTALVEAHRLLEGRLKSRQRPPLLLVGVGPGDLPGVEPGPDLVMIKHLGGGELTLAYGAAEIMVMPSLYEGFGLPALEAMACGTPVVASNRASLPEVVGAAGLLSEPDPEALARAMASLLDDASLWERLAQEGPQQARRFTWQSTAQKTLEAYGQAAGGRGA